MTKTLSTHTRAPEYQIQVANLIHNDNVKLPLFSIKDLIWLLEPTLKGESVDAGLPPLIGVSLSVQHDAQPDVLVFTHKKRLLLLQMPNVEEEDIDGIHPGLELLKNLLLCSSTEVDESIDPLQNTEHAGIGIQLASVSASEIAYLLYHAFEVHSCLYDLDLLANPMGCKKVPPFNSIQLIKISLGQRGISILSLEPHQFQVKKGTVDLENSFLASLIGSTRNSIGSYEIITLFTKSSRNSHSNGLEKKLNDGKIDTRFVPSTLMNFLARFERVEVALKVNKPKVSQARLRTNVDSKGTGIQVKISKKGNSFEVTNEQYKSKLAANTQQLLEISLTDKDGQSRTYSAKTLSSSGRTSTLNFVGKDEKVALEKLRGGAIAALSGGGGSSSVVNSIEIRGRGDHTPAEIDGMKWRRLVMCRREKKDGEPRDDFDSSLLLFPFLTGESARSIEGVLDKKTIKLMARPELHKYNVIISKEEKGTLNESQARAARVIMSPMSGHHSMVEKSESKCKKGESDWQQQQRLLIIHGPPGTGKTSLITACCEQWEKSCTNIEGGNHERARDTVYACCQSNVAVKNIAESFTRAGINFKIIVSPNFYVEWHEDLYSDIQSRVLRTDQLPNSAGKVHDLLDKCDVILSTLSYLSSTKVTGGDCPLFQLRPMRLLFVDEASQIHLRAYPHLFQRFGKTVARIVFLGDDRQLPPFQGDEIIDAGLSVFELKHLRTKAFLLDTCYRLAKPMATFISNNVYDGLLNVGVKNFNPKGGLLDCVGFIDVASSQEERQGTSRVNRGEVAMLVKLVDEYKRRGGSISNIKILTTYDAQRDALEEALKKLQLSGSSDFVFSVDSFQGRESDYIILSLVKDGKPTIKENRSSHRRAASTTVKYLQPGLGFLSNDRRINVALTRAKKGIVIVSNRKFINNTAAETLVGKLQIELQWSGEGGEEHWCDEEDILNKRLPRALFAGLS